jgi:hypothetical protein
MLTPMPDLPPGVLGFDARGRVTPQDYRDVLVPALDNEVERNGRVRFVFHLGPDFEGYTPGALWDDLKLSVRHFKHFEKIAIVTDGKWIARFMKTLGALFPAEVLVFREHDLETAKRWAAAGQLAGASPA